MKKRNIVPKLAAAAMLLCAAFGISAQDERFSQVPKGAALIVDLNLGKLYSSPTFKAAAESGDVLAIRNDLKQIPWNATGIIPDPLIVYAPRMGSSYAMLVGTDKTPEQLASDMKAKYGKNKTVESGKKAGGDTIIVKYLKTDRKTKRQIMKTEAEILYLTRRTVAFGRKDRPLDFAFFAGEKLPASELAFLQNGSSNAVAVGVMRSFPIPASDDPTGLSALVNSGDFVIAEYEPGAASLVLNLECKGDKEAQLAVRRLKSFIKITLVSLFSLDKSLFKELNSSYTATSTGSKAKLEIKLPKSSLDRVRSYYLMEQALLDAAGGIVNAIGASIKK